MTYDREVLFNVGFNRFSLQNGVDDRRKKGKSIFKHRICYILYFCVSHDK